MFTMDYIHNAEKTISYFEEENYYIDGSTEYEWQGKLTKTLGIQKKATSKMFRKMLYGKLPDGGSITRKQFAKNSGRKARLGVDLTLSAPKSVSILALVNQDKTILEAHKKAVEKTLKFVEDNLIICRQYHNKKKSVAKPKNVAFAKFIHTISRSCDPNLHTHSVLINATLADKYRAIDLKYVMDNQHLIDKVYKNELSHILVENNYKLRETKHGFEVDSVSPKLIKHFSKRTNAIEEFFVKHGIISPEDKAKQKLKIRPPKQKVSMDELSSEWLNELKEQFPDEYQNIKASIQHANQAETAAESNINKFNMAKLALKFAINHLSQNETCFDAITLFKTALKHTRGKTTISALSSAVEHFVKDEKLIKLNTKDGELFVNKNHFDIENEAIALVKNGQNCVSPLVDNLGIIKREVKKHEQEKGFSVNKSQKSAIHHILLSRDKIIGLQGHAGVGKTTSMEIIRKISERSDITIRGFAPSNEAAEELANEAGIESETVDMFLIKQNKFAKSNDNTKQLWIIDESSMIGNVNMIRMLRAAISANARVCLTGDYEQLASVPAGKLFYVLQKYGMKSFIMKKIMRQIKVPHLLQTVYDSISNKMKKAFDTLEMKNHIIEIKNTMDRLIKIAEYYLALPENEREFAMVITASNKNRRIIANYIRDKLVESGKVSSNCMKLSVLSSANLSEEETKHSKYLDVGNVIRFGRKYKAIDVENGVYATIERQIDENKVLLKYQERLIEFDLRKYRKFEVYKPNELNVAKGDELVANRSAKNSFGIINGQKWIVDEIHGNKMHVTCKKTGKKRVIDTDKWKHFDYAYAMTVHKSQGKSIKHVFGEIDTKYKNLINKKWFYVLISRTKLNLNLVTDNKKRALKLIQNAQVKHSARVNVDVHQP